MNIIELRSPSLSKIQQKPSWVVYHCNITCLLLSNFQTPESSSLSNKNRRKYFMRTRAELREEGGVQHWGGTSFLSFLFSFFLFFFLKNAS